MSDNWETELDRTARALRGLSRSIATHALEAAADDIDADLERSFSSGRDPEGKAWAARKSGGSWPLLNKTGRLKGSRRVTVKRRFINITYADPVSAYHQTGTVHMRRRRLLPERFPTRWLKMIRARVRSLVKREF